MAGAGGNERQQRASTNELEVLVPVGLTEEGVNQKQTRRVDHDDKNWGIEPHPLFTCAS